jgi:hypothetical protein
MIVLAILITIGIIFFRVPIELTFNRFIMFYSTLTHGVFSITVVKHESGDNGTTWQLPDASCATESNEEQGIWKYASRCVSIN